jgi:hypothetical protein
MSWVSGSPRYRAGDPGLFDFIGKVVGGVANVATGGLAGSIYNTVRGGIQLISGKRPAPAGNLPMAIGSQPFLSTPKQLGIGGLKLTQPTTRPLMPAPVTLPGGAVIVPDSVKVSGFTSPIASAGSATAYFSQPGAAGPTVCGSDGKMKRTHLNRSGYYTKGGYVAPGTKCVTNRRRNPLNPRALSRAMSRVHGAQKAVKALVRFESTSRGGKLIIKRAPRKRR